MPSDASCHANSLPMPLAAPVTIARFPYLVDQRLWKGMHSQEQHRSALHVDFTYEGHPDPHFCIKVSFSTAGGDDRC